MKNAPLLLATIIGTVIMIIGIGWLFGRSGQSTVSTDVTANRTVAEASSTHVVGDPATAPVVVVEFSDFQCPACKAAQPLIKSLLGKYTQNEIAFIYRHLPLQSIHPNAFAGAIASNAAGQQGKFWEMHDLLFERQDEWSAISDTNKLTDAFVGYATELGMNGDTFRAALGDSALTDQVQTDIVAATQLGVNATPTFFVNGQSVSANELASTIEALLSKVSAEASDSADLEASASGETDSN